VGLSVFYGAAKPDNERLALLDQAHVLGEHFWDSSDLYGDNEDLLGKWFKANADKRNDIFLATKFAVRDNGTVIDSSPEHCKIACAQSLKRLGVDQIDLYYCHRVDQKTPIEKTVEAMKELKEEGKIKYLGLSEISSETLRRAHKVHPGMLTGALKGPEDFEEGDFRSFAPRFSKENFPKNLKLVDQLSSIAKKKGVTPSQLTLAWLMAQGQDIFPIPGTTKLERLKENLGAFNVALSVQEEKDIRKAVEEADVGGSRYPESFMKACYADTPPLKQGEAGSGSSSG
jgi:aryl-alcohol dehydrogenase-like predicted oxidoreductase